MILSTSKVQKDSENLKFRLNEKFSDLKDKIHENKVDMMTVKC